MWQCWYVADFYKIYTRHGTHREALKYAEWLLFGRGITACIEHLDAGLWR